MLDDHVDELDLSRRRDTCCQKFAESVADCCALQPDQRADEAPKAMTCLARAFDIAGFADAGVEQHLFKFGQVGWRERSALPQLVKHDVVLVCSEEMSGLLLETREVRFANLRQQVFDAITDLVDEV